MNHSAKSPTKRDTLTQRLALILGPLLSLILIIFVDLKPGEPQVTYTAAVALLMALWWITEALPLAATSLLPLVLFPALGIMDGREVAVTYVNYIIFLFIGGFIVALAMQRWNLHKRIALRILLWFGVRPARILLGFMVATAFLSMWISNTATAMMMMPIALAVVLKLEENLTVNQTHRFSTGIFLGIAYSASIGGIATLVGSPPNLVFVRLLSVGFPEAPAISFASWMAFALPLSVVYLGILWVLLTVLYCRSEQHLRIERSIFRQQYEELGAVSYEERVVLVNFFLLVALWLTRTGISVGEVNIPGWEQLFSHPDYLNDGTVAIFVSLILFLIPARHPSAARVLDWKTAVNLPWGIVLLFGGGFALASGFSNSGLSAWFGEQLQSVKDLPPILIISAVCLVITFLTELTSNVATANVIVPVIGALGVAVNLNPLVLMLAGTISCSFAFMLPVATPPNAIVFGTERLTIADMARIGVFLNLLGVVLITLTAYFLGQWVFEIDFTRLPDWALPGQP